MGVRTVDAGGPEDAWQRVISREAGAAGDLVEALDLRYGLADDPKWRRYCQGASFSASVRVP